MVKKTYFVIDFDSTLVEIEALDTLADIALRTQADKHNILNNIKAVTAAGMRGDIPFDESLKRRLALFKAGKKDIRVLIEVLKKRITPSVAQNREFFQKHKDRIYVISGGFKDYIIPVLEEFCIAPDHILANEFKFDTGGDIIGFDENNYLAQEHGKVNQVKALKLEGDVYVVGDGYTDFQIKDAGAADAFFVFCENVRREEVVKKADVVLQNFDEFVRHAQPKIKVLLLENIHDDARKLFESEGFDIEVIPHALDENELIKNIGGVTILGIRSKTKITQAVLTHADSLKVIGAFCIGTNQVDIQACANRTIAVFNDPFDNTRSVAELVIGEIIMLMRRTFEKSTKLHAGMWDKTVARCYEVRGKKLGIIGYGNIGTQLGVLAEAMGMEVYYFDIREVLTRGNAEKCETLVDLLQTADVITVHVDGRPENRNLIGLEEFRQMKNEALFLNLSRGFVVDIPALVTNLKNGRLGGAAIDVFPDEPKGNQQFVNELQGLANVILTPHVGGNTEEAQRNIGHYVAQKIIRYIQTKEAGKEVI